MLGEFRAEHLPAMLDVLERLAVAKLLEGIAVTGRLKNTRTIIDKIKRTTALHRVQDLAGVRLTLDRGGWVLQNKVVEQLKNLGYRVEDIDDRRLGSGQFGYRAVHVVLRGLESRLVEIQVRTQIQHRWAQVNERFADQWGRQIRYGFSPDDPTAQILVKGVLVSRLEALQYMQDASEDFREAESINAELDSDLTGELRRANPHKSAEAERLLQDASDQLEALREPLASPDITPEDVDISSIVDLNLDDTSLSGPVLALVFYDRRKGQILQRYRGSRERLLAKWVELDFQNRENPDQEVVLLVSELEESLVKTHARYFRSPGELAESPK